MNQSTFSDCPQSRSSELWLAFAIFSTEPGPAALVISNVTLTLK